MTATPILRRSGLASSGYWSDLRAPGFRSFWRRLANAAMRLDHTCQRAPASRARADVEEFAGTVLSKAVSPRHFLPMRTFTSTFAASIRPLPPRFAGFLSLSRAGEAGEAGADEVAIFRSGIATDRWRSHARRAAVEGKQRSNDCETRRCMSTSPPHVTDLQEMACVKRTRCANRRSPTSLFDRFLAGSH